ncbi:MAG: ABC transporter ATP-binding protein [Nitrospirae bacterium]|nr:ABC transporter ATP-binding protein [Nitrospirota bacterium]
MVVVEHLTKDYGALRALDDLSFEIRKGECVGFLGLNGAGKSTALKVLCAYLIPTSGIVRVDGWDTVENPIQVRRKVGFLPEDPPLYGDMEVGTYLLYVGRLRGLSKRQSRLRMEAVEDRISLRDVHREPVAQLSFGYRRRLGIAQAVIHEPSLLILDEPTSGLDPVQIVEMRSLVQGLKGSHTVLVSSHNLSEISRTCDRLLVIQAGRIVAQGSEEELSKALAGRFVLEVEVRGSRQELVAYLRSLPAIEHYEVRGERPSSTLVRIESKDDIRETLNHGLVERGLGVLEMRRVEKELESVFLRLTQPPPQTAS